MIASELFLASLCHLILPFYNFRPQSHSILDFFTFFVFFHLVLFSVKYPDVATASVLEVWTTRYDQWVEDAPPGVMPPRMNVLVVDVQGMDLEVKEPAFHTCRGTR